MNEYTQNQIRTFKTFLIFIMITLIVALSAMITSSQKYRIDYIEYSIEDSIGYQSLEMLYGKSIWFVDENSFSTLYQDNPEVKNLSITKNLPNRLYVSVELYTKLTNIIDERSSKVNVKVLYENSYTVITEELEENLPKVQILNGPVGVGFNGEIISFFKTLEKYSFTRENLKLTYNGIDLIAYYNSGIYELGEAIDLGRKGSILGSYLSTDTCTGTVRFINSESTIEDCI